MRRTRKSVCDKGFTLIGVAISTCIIGMGVAAMVMACGACTRATDGGTQLSQAVFLAQEIREWTVLLPFSDPDPEDTGNPPGLDTCDPEGSADDLDDLMGVTLSPPRGGDGSQLEVDPGWTQNITLTWVDPDYLVPVQPGQSNAIQVEVSIHYHDRPVFTTSWLAIGG